MSVPGVYVIDTASFEAVREKRESMVEEYNSINEEYERIVTTLLQNWEGQGADAFEADAMKMKTNIGGIYDTLNTMNDILTDVRDEIGSVDTSIGSENMKPALGDSGQPQATQNSNVTLSAL